MANFLNLGNAKFVSDLSNDIFVDKSMLIKQVNNNCGKSSSKFMCITRPRRFGKTMALSMLRAYYSKGCSSKELFKNLKIYNDSSFEKHLNKHNVITIDMAGIGTSLENKNDILKEITNLLIEDLKEAFPNILTNEDTIAKALMKIYSSTKETFIFLIDEWDYIYREFDYDTVMCNKYTDFLRSIFKNELLADCIDLVYMTGILPIKRYNSQSALNNFTEYNMLDPYTLTEFVGFTEEEVSDLCKQYNMDINDMKHWYDGYHYSEVGDLYNPKSVVEALSRRRYNDYWVSTSSLEAVTNYMNYDNGELKDIIASLIAGNKVNVNTSLFSNDLTRVDSKDAALTVLIHLGYLAYDRENEQCYIPNYEIRQEFNNGVLSLKWQEIESPLLKSRELLNQTVLLNQKYIEEVFDNNLERFTTIFNRLDENVLSVLLNVSYDYARKEYNFFKEANVGIGRADLILVPYRTNKPGIIFELKVDSSCLEAIKQIKEKDYLKSFTNYEGKILLIGINLNSKTKKHSVLIEEVNKL